MEVKAIDFMKKLLALSIGGAFLTEEMLKSMFSELKLPKELFQSVMESAQKTKDDFLKLIVKEMSTHMIEKINLSEVLTELLRNKTIQVQVNLIDKTFDSPSASQDS